MFQHIELVAFCDQFLFFLIGELKSEVVGKTAYISFHLFVKAFCLNAI